MAARGAKNGMQSPRSASRVPALRTGTQLRAWVSRFEMLRCLKNATTLWDFKRHSLAGTFRQSDSSNSHSLYNSQLTKSYIYCERLLEWTSEIYSSFHCCRSSVEISLRLCEYLRDLFRVGVVLSLFGVACPKRLPTAHPRDFERLLWLQSCVPVLSLRQGTAPPHWVSNARVAVFGRCILKHMLIIRYSFV